MSILLEDSTVKCKLATLAGSSSLDKCRLSCASGVKKKWIESNPVFLDCTGSRFGQSVKEHIEWGEIVVTKIDSSVIPTFETEEDMKEYAAKLKCWDQERCALAKENHNNLSIVVLQCLSIACIILHSACDIGLKVSLEDEK